MRLKPTLVASQLQGGQRAGLGDGRREKGDVHDLDDGHPAQLVHLLVVVRRLGQAVGKDAHQTQQHQDLEDPERDQDGLAPSCARVQDRVQVEGRHVGRRLPESAGKTRRRDSIRVSTHSRAVPWCCRRGRAAQMFTRDSRSGAGHDPAEKAQGGGRESGEMVRLKSHGSSSASRRRAQKAKRLQPPSRWRAVPAAEKENRGAESAPCLFGRGQLHVGGVWKCCRRVRGRSDSVCCAMDILQSRETSWQGISVLSGRLKHMNIWFQSNAVETSS